MKIYHWTNGQSNFGDDINLFLWRHFMPEVVDRDDGALLVGIGTVLSARLPPAKPRVILGSGAGYAALPRHIPADWSIYALRGPLTARLIGANIADATIDPAALLPRMPDFDSGTRTGKIFVPHWTTAADPLWREAVEAAGLEWVDPRQDAKDVVRRIARAELILAESMHSAIVADAFRVPWIPVICTHRVPFKWQDWAHSIDMDYRPVRVGPYAAIQSLVAGVRRTQQPVPVVDADRPPSAEPDRRMPHGRAARLVQSALSRVPRNTLRSVLASRLERVARRKPFLSKANVLEDRCRKLLDRMDAVREDYAKGRIVPMGPG